MRAALKHLGTTKIVIIVGAKVIRRVAFILPHNYKMRQTDKAGEKMTDWEGITVHKLRSRISANK
jgi:hypothetical protein